MTNQTAVFDATDVALEVNPVVICIKPISTYAAKQAAKQVIKAEKELGDMPKFIFAPVTTPVVDDIYSAFVADMFPQDLAKDLNDKVKFQAEAYALMQKANSAKGDLAAWEKKCRRDAKDWREMEPKAAETKMFNRLVGEHKNDGKFDVFKVWFEALQNASSTSEAGIKFAEMRTAVMNADPKISEQHAKNLVFATRAMEAFGSKATEIQGMFDKAHELFELANMICEVRGWDKTEARSKK